MIPIIIATLEGIAETYTVFRRLLTAYRAIGTIDDVGTFVDDALNSHSRLQIQNPGDAAFPYLVLKDVLNKMVGDVVSQDLIRSVSIESACKPFAALTGPSSFDILAAAIEHAGATLAVAAPHSLAQMSKFVNSLQSTVRLGCPVGLYLASYKDQVPVEDEEDLAALSLTPGDVRELSKPFKSGTFRNGWHNLLAPSSGVSILHRTATLYHILYMAARNVLPPNVVAIPIGESNDHRLAFNFLPLGHGALKLTRPLLTQVVVQPRVTRASVTLEEDRSSQKIGLVHDGTTWIEAEDRPVQQKTTVASPPAYDISAVSRHIKPLAVRAGKGIASWLLPSGSTRLKY